MKLLAETFGWELRGESAQFDGVCTDSRKLSPGQLFVALRGENFDAHGFVEQALRNGAAGALVSEPVADAQPMLVTGDSLVALGRLAGLHRDAFSGDLFAVTGSAGKTTTKEMLASILAQVAPVLATQGNFNNEIGVPLTLLELRPEHRYAVIEMGAAKPGDIEYLVDIARPGTAIITNAMPAHLQGFGDVAQVARTKGEIFVPRPDCVAVINIDDDYGDLWRQLASGARIVSYSAQGNAEADVRASQVEVGAAQSRFLLQTHAGDRTIVLQVPGLHNVANALAAAAAALSRGVSLASVQRGLDSFSGVAGRMQFRHAASGQLIIDDSYNANPEALRSAVDVLAMQPGKKALVLGDMAELGADRVEHHRQAGCYARQCGIDLLVAVGPLSAEAAAGFGASAMAFADLRQLIDWLQQQQLLAGYQSCLVKGSRSAGMERVVAILVDAGEMQ
jgi:UDP-N-acetylmuramoyl-tripeptide--D-alanyl-D-alanine ligase